MPKVILRHPTILTCLKTRGVKLDINKLRIDLRGIVYYYQQGIAKVTAKFDDGSKIIVCLDTESAFSCIYDSEGKNIKYSKDANKYSFESIDILPQIGLIKENERKLLIDVTITTNEDTLIYPLDIFAMNCFSIKMKNMSILKN